MIDPETARQVAWEALHAEVCRIDFRYCRDWQSRVVDVVLANIPLVLEAAEEAGKVERIEPGSDDWNADDSTWRLR